MAFSIADATIPSFVGSGIPDDFDASERDQKAMVRLINSLVAAASVNGKGTHGERNGR